MNTLKDKVAIITGGGTGIGKAIAKLFSLEGAKVIIASRNQENLVNAVNEIKGQIGFICFGTGPPPIIS